MAKDQSSIKGLFSMIFKVLGLLQPIHEDDWRKGKIPELETLIQGKPSKIAEAITCLKKWALELCRAW